MQMSSLMQFYWYANDVKNRAVPKVHHVGVIFGKILPSDNLVDLNDECPIITALFRVQLISLDLATISVFLGCWKRAGRKFAKLGIAFSPPLSLFRSLSLSRSVCLSLCLSHLICLWVYLSLSLSLSTGPFVPLCLPQFCAHGLQPSLRKALPICRSIHGTGISLCLSAILFSIQYANYPGPTEPQSALPKALASYKPVLQLISMRHFHNQSCLMHAAGWGTLSSCRKGNQSLGARQPWHCQWIIHDYVNELQR